MTAGRLAKGTAPRALVAALFVLTALGPLACVLHEAAHVVHASAPAYRPHDDASHHDHRPIDGHRECAVCAHAKSQSALIAQGPRPALATLASRLHASPASHPSSHDLAALPAPRAPPAAS